MPARETAGGEPLHSTGTQETAAESPGARHESPRADQVPLGPGARFGRYSIGELLGVGGMGMVFGARDPDLDRKVAIKILRDGATAGTGTRAARARLLREARAMARLRHPNVITVYEVGSRGDVDYVAMEYVDGCTLAEWLSKPRPPRDVLARFVAAGRGLAAAHAAGIVHRDFKPSNVLLDRAENVIVTDFGLARWHSDPDPELSSPSLATDETAVPSLTTLTQTGTRLGTPAYMSPEQHVGDETDTRSDQFSFCVALHEALYGQLPFGDTAAEIRAGVLRGEVRREPRGSKVPARLRRILLRGLSVDPRRRYPSMNALLADLTRRPTRRLALAAAVLGPVALVGVVVASRPAIDPAAACERGGSELEAVWNPGARARLRQAFLGTGHLDAAPVHERFARAVDGYVSAWRSAHRDSCLATYVSRVQREQDHYLRMDCLVRRRNELRSLLSTFTQEPAIDRATQAIQTLVPAQSCSDLDALRAGLSPPRSGATRARVEALREELAAVLVLEESMQFRAARARAEKAVATARTLQYPPVEAEALYRLGSAAYAMRDPRTARTALDEAILVAEESGHDEYRARALVLRAGVSATMSSNRAEAEQLARRARAAVSRYQRDPRIAAELDTYLAGPLTEDGKYDAALQLLERAAAAYRTGAARLELSEALEQIAWIHESRNQHERARAVYAEIVAICRDAFGDAHPSTLKAYDNLARTLRALGDYDRAHEYSQYVAGHAQTTRGQEILDALAGNMRSRLRPRRSVTVQVLSSGGQPVPAADVIIGEQIQADGKYLFGTAGAVEDYVMSVQKLRTDARGRITFQRVPADIPMWTAAESTDLGRSLPVEVPAREMNPGVIELRLRRFGGLQGKVAHGALEPRSIVVIAASREIANPVKAYHRAVVQSDGTYHFHRLPAGGYHLLFIHGEPQQSQMHLPYSATVAAGRVTSLDVDVIPRSGASLAVHVRGPGGQAISDAVIFLTRRPITALRVADIEELLPQVVASGIAMYQGYQQRDKQASFSSLLPGTYSACVIPFAGDLKDPEVNAHLVRNEGRLRTHCRRIPVRPGDQRVVLEVPAMEPPPLAAEGSSGDSAPSATP
jgi:tetratricopeptide (TPR) repeat protein